MSDSLMIGFSGDDSHCQATVKSSNMAHVIVVTDRLPLVASRPGDTLSGGEHEKLGHRAPLKPSEVAGVKEETKGGRLAIQGAAVEHRATEQFSSATSHFFLTLRIKLKQQHGLEIRPRKFETRKKFEKKFDFFTRRGRILPPMIDRQTHWEEAFDPGHWLGPKTDAREGEQR